MKSKIFSVVLGVALLGVGVWGYNQYRTRVSYENYIQNQHQRSYYDMVTSLKNLDTLTSKSLVSTSSNSRSMMLSDIWWQSNFAQQNLSQLPFDGRALQRTNKFLTQLGDFSYELAKKNSKGFPISNAEINKLQQLHNQVGFLGEEIQRLNAKIDKNGVGLSEFKTISYTTDKAAGQLIDGTFKRLDKQMQQYPTLVYDGPFSDSILRKKPLGLTGNIMTAAEAKTMAQSFIDKLPGKTYTVQNTGLAKGRIPAYSIRIMANDKSEESYMDVSRQGGHVIWMLNPRKVNKRILTTTEAQVYAQKFLDRNGLISMKPSYFYRHGNVSVLTFTYDEGGITIYPDLLKVKVALDTGQVVGFEDLGFLMNHHARKLLQPEISIEKARAKIPSHLTIVSEKLTLIPTETLEEKLCYEFRVRLGADTFLIYINAINGEEERILKILDLPNGQWAM